MKKLILCGLLISFSCAKQPLIKYQNDHKNYLIQVKRAKESKSKEEFHKFIKTQIQTKEMELTNLKTIKSSATMRHSESESQQTLNQNDINYFKANSAKIELHQIDTRIKLIEKQLFFLKSQLSAIENK